MVRDVRDDVLTLTGSLVDLADSFQQELDAYKAKGSDIQPFLEVNGDVDCYQGVFLESDLPGDLRNVPTFLCKNHEYLKKMRSMLTAYLSDLAAAIEQSEAPRTQLPSQKTTPV